MMIHYSLICEFTAVVLYEHDIVENQPSLHHRYCVSCLADDAPWLFDALWMDCSNFMSGMAELKLSMFMSSICIKKLEDNVLFRNP